MSRPITPPRERRSASPAVSSETMHAREINAAKVIAGMRTSSTAARPADDAASATPAGESDADAPAADAEGESRAAGEQAAQSRQLVRRRCGSCEPSVTFARTTLVGAFVLLGCVVLAGCLLAAMVQDMADLHAQVDALRGEVARLERRASDFNTAVANHMQLLNTHIMRLQNQTFFNSREALDSAWQALLRPAEVCVDDVCTPCSTQ